MSDGRIRRVLVATDGSECSMEAARYAASLLSGMLPMVVIIHVAPDDPFPTGTTRLAIETPEPAGEDEVDIARAMWEGTQAVIDQARLPFDSIGASVEGAIRQGDPADQILDFAGDEDFDLIVLGSRGMGEPESEGLGRTSSAIVRRAPCPVLVVRPRGG